MVLAVLLRVAGCTFCEGTPIAEDIFARKWLKKLWVSRFDMSSDVVMFVEIRPQGSTLICSGSSLMPNNYEYAYARRTLTPVLAGLFAAPPDIESERRRSEYSRVHHTRTLTRLIAGFRDTPVD